VERKEGGKERRRGVMWRDQLFEAFNVVIRLHSGVGEFGYTEKGWVA